MNKKWIVFLFLILFSNGQLFAQTDPKEQVQKLVDQMFERHEGVTLCRENDRTPEFYSLLTINYLIYGKKNTSPNESELVSAVWTLFPCPFRPNINFVSFAKEQDILGVWIFPETSQHLRFGEKSTQKSPTHPLKVNCEAIGYFNGGEYRTILSAGKQSCIINDRTQVLKSRNLPKVSNWHLLKDGRVRITRTDVKKHVEEWDIFIVNKKFSYKGVTFNQGDLISYLRKEKNNEIYNASTQFRHLIKMKN